MKTALMNFLVLLGTSLLPVYLGESGGIQISHAILAMAALFYLIFYKIAKPPKPTIILLVFIYFILIRESPGALEGLPLFSLKDTPLKPFLFWSYNLVILVLFGDYFARQKNAGNVLFLAVAAGISIATTSIFVLGYSPTGGINRAVGTFNNPNQLGYYSVCAFSALWVLYYEKHVSKLFFLSFSSLCVFLSIASLSKSAMISIAIPFFYSLFSLTSSFKGKNGIIAIVVFFVVIGAGLVYFTSSGSSLSEFGFYQRLARIGSDSDDTLAARGYWLIYEMGWLEFLFGFSALRAIELIGYEVHSTLASVFVYYGIFGLSLFVGFLVTWAIQVYKTYGLLAVFAICFPAMLYGVTHDGTRFTLFWIVVAMSLYAPLVRNQRTSGTPQFSSVHEGGKGYARGNAVTGE